MTCAGYHSVPTILDRRLRSPECRNGRGDCADSLCLCACHEVVHLDGHLRRVVGALDDTYWQAATPGGAA